MARALTRAAGKSKDELVQKKVVPKATYDKIKARSSPNRVTRTGRLELAGRVNEASGTVFRASRMDLSSSFNRQPHEGRGRA